ncbi:MAG: histidine phosphatase family protein [Bryobacteraceae bacterium]
MPSQLWLVRHGETEWSKSGQHTGLTDLPLTPEGVAKAGELRNLLEGQTFNLVMSSPLQRAAETCRLAGFTDAQIDPDLLEWDYGAYEGRTTPDVWKDRPGWSLWRDGVPNGESIEQVAERATRVIERAIQAASGGQVALFAHGHVLRVLAACWLGIEPEAARLFALSTASVSVLGWERDTRVVSRWNLT